MDEPLILLIYSRVSLISWRSTRTLTSLAVLIMLEFLLRRSRRPPPPVDLLVSLLFRSTEGRRLLIEKPPLVVRVPRAYITSFLVTQSMFARGSGRCPLMTVVSLPLSTRCVIDVSVLTWSRTATANQLVHCAVATTARPCTSSLLRELLTTSGKALTSRLFSTGTTAPLSAM